MLKKDFIRDGNRRIIGSVTTGYSDTSKTVRDDHNRIGVAFGERECGRHLVIRPTA